MEHLYFVVHTHWDREWYQPFQRMRARLLTMTDKMLRLLESGALPCFHFDGQTIVLEDYLEVRPAGARRIAKLVKAGKLQIGPWYLLADSFLASGEALIRNLEIGSRIARRFGKPAPAICPISSVTPRSFHRFYRVSGSRRRSFSAAWDAK